MEKEDFYENPYIPSEEELGEETSLPLTSNEAQFLLIRAIGRGQRTPQNMKLALEQIRDSVDGEGDLVKELKKINDEEDWN
jgi:hypothetical protein